MRTTEVDLQRIQAFAKAEGGLARPRTAAEWRAELLAVGLLVDLGRDGGDPVRGVQRALTDLVRAEANVEAVDQPTPWSVGGVPPAAWAIIAGTWIALTAIWNSLYGFFGGAVLLGAVSILGLVHHRRGARHAQAQLRDARAAVRVAQATLCQRVLELTPEVFPVTATLVCVTVKGAAPRPG